MLHLFDPGRFHKTSPSAFQNSYNTVQYKLNEAIRANRYVTAVTSEPSVTLRRTVESG